MNTFKLVCYCILSFLILQKIQFTNCNQKFELASKYYSKTNSIDCIGNPNIITNITCKLKAISWEHSGTDMDADIVVPIRNMSVRLELYKYTNQFRPFLINLTVNGCDLMKKRSPYIYANLAAFIVRKYSNINHTCPYSGHVYARNIFVDIRFIPFNIPAGKYKLAFSFYEGWPYVYAGAIAMTATLEERRNKKRTTLQAEP